MDSIGKVDGPGAGGDIKISSGSHSGAEKGAEAFGLTKTSGVRTDEDVARGIGYSGDDHHKGIAEDFAGPQDKMDAFAKWAANSGMFNKVIWQGKDLVRGIPIEGHYDHVHVSFGK